MCVCVCVWCCGQLYGSCFTGLDLASSDVDVVVCNLPTSAAVRSRGPASHPSSPEEAHHRTSSACKLPDVPPLMAVVPPTTPAKDLTASSSSTGKTEQEADEEAAGAAAQPCRTPQAPARGPASSSSSSSEVEQLTSGGRVFFLHQLAAALEVREGGTSKKAGRWPELAAEGCVAAVYLPPPVCCRASRGCAA